MTINKRRPFPRLLALATAIATLTVLTACGSDQSASPPASTHEVTQEFGTTQVPDDPKAVVALDESAAMKLLAVDVVPKAVFTSHGSTIAQGILAHAGSEIVDIPVGSTITSTTVLSHHPDLVVFSSFGDRSTYDQLAPTVATLPLSTTSDWKKQLSATADALGKTTQAQHIIDVLDTLLADVKKGRGASSPSTIAVLMSYAGGLSSISGGAPLETLLIDAGFDVPKAEQVAGTGGQQFVNISPENLPDHDADVIAILDEGVWDAAKVRNQPTFSRLTGHSVDVNGDMWFGYSPFAVYWTLTDLAAIESSDWSGVAAEKDASDRYDRFRQLIGR